MGFDNWNPFKKKVAPDPAVEAERQATLARRITGGMPVAPTGTPGKLGRQLEEKNRAQTEVREAKEHILGEFSVALAKIERPDEYLPALGRILENHHATPEVVRLVATACANELADFYGKHAGTDAQQGLQGRFQEARLGRKIETPLVPDAFAVAGRLQSTRAMSGQMNDWSEQWIRTHTAAANEQMDKKQVA